MHVSSVMHFFFLRLAHRSGSVGNRVCGCPVNTISVGEGVIGNLVCVVGTGVVGAGEGEVVVVGAMDEDGLRLGCTDADGFADGDAFIVTVYPPPSNPEISGPLKGKPKVNYTLSVSTTAPDQSDLYYYIDCNTLATETKSSLTNSHQRTLFLIKI